MRRKKALISLNISAIEAKVNGGETVVTVFGLLIPKDSTNDVLKALSFQDRTFGNFNNQQSQSECFWR